MPQGLSHYARLIITDEATARRELTLPVLVWTLPPAPDGTEMPMQTLTGVPSTRPRAGEPLVFEVKKAGNKANAFALGVTIGRTESNDIPVDDESVSRFHAWLQQDLRTHEWTLVDAESKNGTWMGLTKLSPNRAEKLAPGARLRFGDVEMVFYTPEAFFAYVARMK